MSRQKKDEKERQREQREKKRKQEELKALYDQDSDDYFAYIAGYTDGGAPYGTTWEDMGIDPGSPYEEKERLLEEKCRQEENLSKIDIDDLPFDLDEEERKMVEKMLEKDDLPF